MSSVQSLQTDGKVYISYPHPLRAAMQDTMECWKKFCQLPEETKLRFGYTPDHAQSGNGYELKKESGATLDQKENFHFRLSAQKELEHAAAEVGAPEAIALVHSLHQLPALIEPLLLDFADNVETTFHVPGFTEDVRSSIPQLIIRLLHYFGEVDPLDEIAKPHIDKGGFTLHLWESDGGVQQLSLDKKEWIPVPVSHDQAVIFPASGLQYLLKNDVKALCHRVIATAESSLAGRYSAVGFVDFRTSAHYDKKTHGRLQDWPAGFNYDMPYEEFKKLFVH